MSRQLFLDMDGVLADFDKKAHEILTEPPSEFESKYGAKEFWNALSAYPDFYNSFDPMPDALYLWGTVAHLSPIVLTGLPKWPGSEGQKRTWIARILGWHVPVITCRAKDKSRYAKPGDVLIDDRPQYKSLWEAVGGTFITHTRAALSIEALQDLGLLRT